MLKNKQFDAAVELLDTGAKIEKLTDGAIRRGENGDLFIEDDQMPQALADKIRLVAASDYDPTPFVNFWKRLKENPSENSRKQFYKFVQNCDCNITADGMVILYKGLSPDLRSKHSSKHHCRDGTVIDLLHTPGEWLEIPREDAADNPAISCSTGLHCAPWDYVQNYYSSYGATVELLVDPKDVVSVPNDGNGHKMRVCRYKTLRKMGPDDKPLKDVLAEMKRKETDGAKQLRAKAKTLKKAVVASDSNRLILPPEILMAADIDPRTKLNISADGASALIAAEDSSSVHALAKRAQARGSTLISQNCKPSIRGSLEIPNVVLRAMHSENGIYTEYVCTVMGSKKIRIVPKSGAELVKGSCKLIESKKKALATKSKEKVAKKVAKKAAKAAKKASTPAKKVAKKASTKKPKSK